MIEIALCSSFVALGILSVLLSKKSRKLVVLQTEHAAQCQQHKSDIELWKQRLDDLQRSQTDWDKTISSMCHKALESNQSTFLNLAEKTLESFQHKTRHQIQDHQKILDQISNPLSQMLTTLNTKVEQLEKTRLTAYEGLRHHVNNLLEAQKDWKKEAEQLNSTLRVPQQRGRWGEIQLRRIIELAGMVSYCDFKEQPSLNQGSMRPDIIVTLPGNRWIIIDAKAPWQGHEDHSVHDAGKRLRQHIKVLAGKAYQEAGPQGSPDMVVMFLPMESFLTRALEADESLMDFAAHSRVMIATPTSLLALLHGIAYGWRQETLAKNTQDLRDWGKEIHKRLYDLSQYIEGIGNALHTMTQSYNRAVGNIQRRLLPAARKLESLGLAKTALPSLQTQDPEHIRRLPATSVPSDLVSSDE